MYTERGRTEELYPYEGEFYYTEDNPGEDGDLIGGEDAANEVSVLKTRCDIQEASKMFNSGALIADYNVYFPLERGGLISVRRGMSFRGVLHGMDVGGTVTGLFPGQLGVKATVKEVDV